MESIKLQSHAGPDGILKLEVPVGLSDMDYEVVVIVQPVESISPNLAEPASLSPEELGWPPGFFEQTEGSLEDDPIERPPQLPYETREELL